MLDVYQVQGIVKQAQAEFRQKFEQDYPNVVEFLAENILPEARKGNVFINLNVKEILSDSVSIYDIEKYLEIKGFYVRVNATTIKDGNKSFTVQYNDIEIKWPKG